MPEPQVPVAALLAASARTTARPRPGGTKNSISICSNSRVRKMKLPGRDLVAEALADLGDPERRLLAGELQVVLEVEEDALGGLGPQVDGRALLLDRPDRGLEHQVEVARLGQVAVGRLAGVLGRLAAAGRDVEVVGAEAQLAGAAVDQRVGEAGQVAARLPRLRVLDDRRVERHDVVALLQHRPPPLALDVVLEQHAVVAVVVARADPAVDLAALEDEPAPLAQRDDLVHGDGVVGHRARDASQRWRRRAPLGTPALGVPRPRAILHEAMPIYEYRCEKGHTFEVMQRFTDDPRDQVRGLRAPGRSGSSTRSPSTSRARASTTPTTAPASARAR